MNYATSIRSLFVAVVVTACSFMLDASLWAKPKPTELLPASGSGTVSAVNVQWNQISITVDGHEPDTYAYGPDVTVLDPAGKVMDIRKIQGLEVRFTAIPNKHRVNML